MSRISGAVPLSAGGSHGLVLKSDGTVWSWGANVAIKSAGDLRTWGSTP